MSHGQAVLLVVLFAASLLEGEVAILGFAVLASAPSFPLSPLVVALVGLAGTLTGDETVYWIGRLTKDPTTFRFRRRPVLSPERRREIERFFDAHGSKAVFFLRYAFGLRTVGYFFAGALRMRWRRFMAADLLGAGSWVAVLVVVGYLVGWPLLRWVEQGGLRLLLAAPLTAVLVWLVIRVQRRLERR